ncbi:isoprenylcysteine carboxylmethyltransferase family protein [Psychrobacter sp. M13]|uniref:methyltransferase family protein n=1 Tax=Psychrobacter sp. M13 TaxID=3067275 RepID=UPI00273B03D0|nr:isoprenylcysteine carboxylmethyltransferase family protein [Psychrobacter sp. M13]WLP95567.1 isoprenylcysteine carboxylmethyltransferase family protein [Psychrobacter sp. M13]
MSSLELKAPPVLQVITIAFAMYGLSGLFPNLQVMVFGTKWLASGLAVVGMALAIMGILAFKKAQTTVNPHTPEKSVSLVTKGIYKYTRNPMYLGMLLVLLGWAFYLSNFAALLVLPIFIIYMSRFQIQPEERFMKQKFGDEYRAYIMKVRRWL